MIVYCPECENACSDKAPFCPKCGHPIGGDNPTDISAAIHAELAEDQPKYKTCPACDQRMEGTRERCPACGYDYAIGYQRVARPQATDRYSGLAITSFVCGLVSVTVCAGIPLGIMAIVFGDIAQRDIKRNPQLGGKGLAVAGRILGIFGLIVGFVALVVWLAFL